MVDFILRDWSTESGLLTGLRRKKGNRSTAAQQVLTKVGNYWISFAQSKFQFLKSNCVQQTFNCSNVRYKIRDDWVLDEVLAGLREDGTQTHLERMLCDTARRLGYSSEYVADSSGAAAASATRPKVLPTKWW